MDSSGVAQSVSGPQKPSAHGPRTLHIEAAGDTVLLVVAANSASAHLNEKP